MKIRHLLPNSVIRRACLDFLRSILCASLPCALMSRTEKVDGAKTLVRALRHFYECSHGSSTNSAVHTRACTACSFALGRGASKFEEIIPTVACLVMTVAEYEVSARSLQGKEFARNISIILKDSILVMDSFNDLFHRKQPQSAKSYSELYKTAGDQPNTPEHDGLIPISKSEAGKTGDLFPRRGLVRPRITFAAARGGSEKTDECSKDYRRAPSHSPGLFTVQCACQHPKLLRVTVMSANESLSTALTAVLSRFPKLPPLVFYDNACNIATSTNLRLAWVSEQTLFLCDRFHYRTHKCTSIFDPDVYRQCDTLRWRAPNH